MSATIKIKYFFVCLFILSRTRQCTALWLCFPKVICNTQCHVSTLSFNFRPQVHTLFSSTTEFWQQSCGVFFWKFYINDALCKTNSRTLKHIILPFPGFAQSNLQLEISMYTLSIAVLAADIIKISKAASKTI